MFSNKISPTDIQNMMSKGGSLEGINKLQTQQIQQVQMLAKNNAMAMSLSNPGPYNNSGDKKETNSA